MDAQQFIEVGLHHERFAVPILGIQEIIRMQAIAEIPNSHSDLEGVINLRGKMVPVVSLCKTLGKPYTGHSSSTRIVIVCHGEVAVGLVVDRVYHVTTFSRIQNTPVGSDRVDQNLIAGIGHADDRLVSILTIEAVLEQRGL
ncbi:chemotaxis protein CheW [Paenibacillus baekrokdamisoli]|uniref:Chemotaxis protein CheW n=1 Tax=Paenibacillus baekrokdamisoli TaxID=1712516 RepID=A0A3G9JFA5_9BACL|nr:chemotaxis protein CheW [Paenibacillus baekrokdamisoli]MBB3071373.1 purine-binding chemotaxis protein CheW [Paenibacillus baekrokdamisoli]BBH24591.1 chemotaxis protein CheW [Paenibacillus baekrokdamisoli]